MNPFESLNSIDLGLWPHQAMLADDTIKAIRRGLNCCSVLATGGGKSLAMTETTRQILAGGLYSTVGVACHSVDILRQLEAISLVSTVSKGIDRIPRKIVPLHRFVVLKTPGR